MRSRTRPLVTVATLAVTFAATGARAADWPPEPGNPGTPQPESGYTRPTDRAQGDWWKKKVEVEPAAPLPPAVHFPGLPGPPRVRAPRGATKTGPMTLADLALASDGKGGFRGRRPGYQFSIDPDGTVHFADRPSVDLSPALLLGMVGLVGSFDLTDLVMRLHGDDPYSHDKARIIDLTREMRTKMTDKDRTERRREAVSALPRQLVTIWERQDLTPALKRRVLFSLWDELLDNTSSPDGRAAADARKLVLDFVRTRLPAGSSGAFTTTELIQLNGKRRSQARFAPYDPTPLAR